MSREASDVQEKIKLYDRAIERKFESLEGNKVPEKNVPRTYRIIASNTQSIGLYRIALDSCDEAIPDLTTATEWYRDAIQEFRTRRDSPKDNFEGETTLLDYLYCALLSGDDDLLTEAAELVREVEPEHYDRFDTQWRYYYTQALAATILDTGEQRTHLDELEASIPDHDEDHETFFTALWIALSGLDDRDEKRFLDGVEQFLDWHDGQVDFETKTSAEDLVCKQVASLVVLARRTGMDVRVDSEYVPDCIYEVG